MKLPFIEEAEFGLTFQHHGKQVIVILVLTVYFILVVQKVDRKVKVQSFVLPYLH